MHLHPVFEIMLFAIGLGTAALGGVLGMAGGIFMVPLLTIFGHIEIHSAVGASLVSVIACSCASAPDYLRARLTDLRLAVLLETATTLGALTGVLLFGLIPVALLYLLFAAILLVSAQQMLVRREAALAAAPLGEVRVHPRGRLRLGWGLMYGAGLISALLGIGSGVLKIPALDSALRLPLKISSATSTFMIGVTAAASAGAYYLRGDILPGIAGPLALGSVLGAVLGARILLASPSHRLRLLFVAVLVVLAVQMGLHAFGLNLWGRAAGAAA